MRISIVTVTYNSEKFIDEYLASIKKQNFVKLQVIIVDCGSKDQTIPSFKTTTDNFNLKIIKNKKNLGFAGGNNLGVKEATGKYLFFLNPDTKLDNNCLNALWNKAESLKKKERSDFLLIPRQRNYKTGEFYNDGVCVDIFGYPYKIFNAEKPTQTKPPFFCDGAALFLPKKTFFNLGKFDQNLFMFNEDVDLSWKAHLLGIPLINHKEAVVYHYSGGSLTGGAQKEIPYKTNYLRRYLGERNALRNLLKNYSLMTLLWVLPLYLMMNFAEIAVFFVARKPKAAIQYFKAWWWNLKNLGLTLQKRNFIQKLRKVNDRQILKRLYFGSGKLKTFLIIKIPEFE